MNIENEITTYLNSRYQTHKKDIIETLCEFFGEELREEISGKINNLDIVYFVNRKDLNICLEDETLDSNERKLLEYFLDKMNRAEEIDFANMTPKEIVSYLESQELKEEEKTLIAAAKLAIQFDPVYGDNNTKEETKKLSEILLKAFGLIKQPMTTQNHCIIGNSDNDNTKWIPAFKFQGCSITSPKTSSSENETMSLPLYNSSFSPDSDYFWSILHHLKEFYSSMNLWYGNINLGRLVYNKALFYFNRILTNKLHQKGIYVFDNKNLTKNEELYNKLASSSIFKKIESYFGALFPKFITNPSEVIELVGKENFTKFALWLVYLAPFLEENYYEEFDENEKDEQESQLELSSNLDEVLADIDIDEVLEDMYLEYLRHQKILLTTIDMDSIIKAKKLMQLKQVKELAEKQQDSNYYDISLIFKYLEKYGNCQIRLVSDYYTYTCNVINFEIKEDGTLSINKFIETYDKIIFNNDGVMNCKAKLKKSFHMHTYSEDEYPLVMAPIMYYSLYNLTNITTNRSLSPKNTSCIETLYNVTYPMYNLDLHDLISWIKSGSRGAINILLNQNSTISRENSFDDIEEKTRTLKNRINEVLGYWNKVQNSQSKEEYQSAAKEWDRLEKKAARR